MTVIASHLEVIPALLLLLAIVGFVISRFDSELGAVLLQVAVGAVALCSGYEVIVKTWLELGMAAAFGGELSLTQMGEAAVPFLLGAYFLAVVVTCFPVPLRLLRPAGYVLHFGIAPVLMIAYTRNLHVPGMAVEIGVKEFCFVLLWFQMLDVRTKKAAGQSNS